MKESNIVYNKSLAFSVRIVNLAKYLKQVKKEYILYKQILRSGTSISANIAESEFAQSKADFVSKLSIARKEAAETKCWIDILYATEYIDVVAYESLMTDCVEILKLLTSSIITVSNKYSKQKAKKETKKPHNQ